MITFPNSPKVPKGGLVLIDPGKPAAPRIIVLQCNRDRATRKLLLQATGRRIWQSLESLRLNGPLMAKSKVGQNSVP